MKIKITIVFVILAFVTGITFPVLANEEGHTSTEADVLERTNEVDASNKERNERIDAHTQEAEAKKEKAREFACQKRQQSLAHRNERIQKAFRRHLEFMDTLFARLQRFSTDERLSIRDYQALLENVNSAKTDAHNAVDAFVSDEPDFDCTSDKHQDVVVQFKGNVATTVHALKAYKSALHELVKAIKAETTKRTEEGE